VKYLESNCFIARPFIRVKHFPIMKELSVTQLVRVSKRCGIRAGTRSIKDFPESTSSRHRDFPPSTTEGDWASGRGKQHGGNVMRGIQMRRRAIAAAQVPSANAAGRMRLAVLKGGR
jgi:hypothetical protein